MLSLTHPQLGATDSDRPTTAANSAIRTGAAVSFFPSILSAVEVVALTIIAVALAPVALLSPLPGADKK